MNKETKFYLKKNQHDCDMFDLISIWEDTQSCQKRLWGSLHVDIIRSLYRMDSSVEVASELFLESLDGMIPIEVYLSPEFEKSLPLKFDIQENK